MVNYIMTSILILFMNKIIMWIDELGIISFPFSFNQILLLLLFQYLTKLDNNQRVIQLFYYYLNHQ
jgi:hypothetical protein